MALLEEMLAKFESMDKKDFEIFAKEVNDATASLKWIPNPGPQTEAYKCQADELFYGGSAGGGKTDLLVGLALNCHKNSLILRRTNKEAEKLPFRFEEILGHDGGLNRSTGTWRLEDKVIDMGGCQLESDKQKRKGIAHDMKAFDEVGDFSESQFTFISAWNRSADPKQRCRVVATGNPPTNAEGYWVIKRWAAWLDDTHHNPAKDGELRWYTLGEDGKEIEVEGRGPHMINGEEVIARSRTFIRAWLSDNPFLAQTNYDSVLAALPERERLAYRDGRFDLSVQDALGQAIPTSWIRLAQERWRDGKPEGVPMCSIGVDMTGGGKDPMIMAPRYDSWFDNIVEIPSKEFAIEKMGTQAAGHILGLRRDKALVILDLGGGYGNSCYEHLRANDIAVYGYKGSENFAGRSKDSNIPFQNKRSAAIWRVREALDPSQPGGSTIALPDDPELVADLTSPTYKIEGHVIKVESKEKVCERLGRSTDRGDAVIMAWFQGLRDADSALDWIDSKQKYRLRGQAPKVITKRGIRGRLH